MRRLVIAIDCDDVLIPTAEAIINDYNDRFGTSLELKDMYQPATLQTWGTDDNDVAIERVYDFLRSDAHASIMPEPEAIFAIKELAGRHELHLVTGRASFLEELTRGMLEQYFGGCFKSIEHTNFIVSSTNIATRRSKGDVCRAIGASLLIDDHVQHGHSVLDAELERVIVFGDYPWNRGEPLVEGMVRCNEWPAVLKEVERLERG